MKPRIEYVLTSKGWKHQQRKDKIKATFTANGIIFSNKNSKHQSFWHESDDEVGYEQKIAQYLNCSMEELNNAVDVASHLYLEEQRENSRKT